MTGVNLQGVLCPLPTRSLKDHPLRTGFYDQAHLEELVASIRTNGLWEPLLVRVSGNGGDDYEILSGHYRVRAERRLRRAAVPCQVMACDERTAKLVFCSARILTRGVSAIEEALLLRELVQADGMTMTAAGALFGRSKWWVSRRLKLLNALDPAVQAEVGRGALPPRLAQELSRLPRGTLDQPRVLSLIQQYHLSKEELVYLVDQWLKADDRERDRLLTSFESPCPGRGHKRSHPSSARELELYAVQKLKGCTGILDDLTDMAHQAEVPAADWWPHLAYRNLIGAFRKLDGLLLPGGDPPIAAVTRGATGKKGI